MEDPIRNIPPKENPLASFTLIEILAVISIILILAGITIGVIGYANNKAIRDRTTTEIKFIELQLERYKNEEGDYPTNSFSSLNNLFFYLGAARNNGNGTRPIAQFKSGQYTTNGAGGTNSLVDPYGNPYGYQCTGSNNLSGFDLWSTAGSGSPVMPNNQTSYTNSVGAANPTGIATWITNWRH
ncbi:MAG: type II secretion system protein GspG [Verrucomicrobiota bacterium]|nr:type II secretion system protein GspG [Verrucomicrobiota bacterium]